MGLPRYIANTLRFELLRPVAQGGMGSVYEALQHGANGFRKRVALKIIRDEYAALPLFRQNFLGEAQLVAELVHTNIVQIYHLAYWEDRYLIVMEYVDGKNLEQFLLQHLALGRRVPLKIAAFIVSRVVRALLHAHHLKGSGGKPLGIVHRDVSPKNVMISFGGDVKLTDFGIAKAFNLMYEQEGEVIAGRSGYLSPEQARKEVTDARADLFSCGVVLLELVLGRNYFEGDNAAASRHNICHLPVRNLHNCRADIDSPLLRIIEKALCKEREARYQHARDLLEELENYLYLSEPVPTLDKLGQYMLELYAEGEAYEDDISERPGSIEVPLTQN